MWGVSTKKREKEADTTDQKQSVTLQKERVVAFEWEQERPLLVVVLHFTFFIVLLVVLSVYLRPLDQITQSRLIKQLLGTEPISFVDNAPDLSGVQGAGDVYLWLYNVVAPPVQFGFLSFLQVYNLSIRSTLRTTVSVESSRFNSFYDQVLGEPSTWSKEYSTHVLQSTYWPTDGGNVRQNIDNLKTDAGFSANVTEIDVKLILYCGSADTWTSAQYKFRSNGNGVFILKETMTPVVILPFDNPGSVGSTIAFSVFAFVWIVLVSFEVPAFRRAMSIVASSQAPIERIKSNHTHSEDADRSNKIFTTNKDRIILRALRRYTVSRWSKCINIATNFMVLLQIACTSIKFSGVNQSILDTSSDFNAHVPLNAQLFGANSLQVVGTLAISSWLLLLLAELQHVSEDFATIILCLKQLLNSSIHSVALVFACQVLAFALFNLLIFGTTQAEYANYGAAVYHTFGLFFGATVSNKDNISAVASIVYAIERYVMLIVVLAFSCALAAQLFAEINARHSNKPYGIMSSVSGPSTLLFRTKPAARTF